MAASPRFQALAVAPSSAHAEYHTRAIQFYGQPRFEGHTAHQDDYKAWELPERERLMAPPQYRPALPFTAVSTYADVYKEHELGQRPSYSPDATKGHRSNGLKFEAHSSYANDFTPKDIPLRQQFNPCQKPRSSAKFDGVSSYADDFHLYEFDPDLYARNLYGQQHPYKTSNLPFDSVSAYKDTFVPHPLEPRQPYSGPRMALHKSAKFEGSTTHQDNFKHWDLPPRREGLGVAIVGNRFYTFISAQRPLPAMAKQTFTTVTDGQREMCLMIYEGCNPIASKNRLLGQFQLVDIPPAPFGVPKLDVTFHLDTKQALKVEAVDMASGQLYTWRRQDGLATIGVLDVPFAESAIVPEGQAIACT